MKPWTYRVEKRGKYGGESIVFALLGYDSMRSEWYPPWQNELQRDNAACIVADLNAAYAKRNRAIVAPPNEGGKT